MVNGFFSQPSSDDITQAINTYIESHPSDKSEILKEVMRQMRERLYKFGTAFVDNNGDPKALVAQINKDQSPFMQFVLDFSSENPEVSLKMFETITGDLIEYKKAKEAQKAQQTIIQEIKI